MKLKAVLAGALCLGMGLAGVAAADTPEKTREEMMESVGKSMKTLTGISKGDTPYDAEAVKTSLKTISIVGKSFPDQFPAGSEASSKGQASPKIWENFEDFKSKATKLGADADLALATLPADAAGVGATIKTIGANCGACHQVYRLKR